MEVKTKAKYIRMSPRKLRQVAKYITRLPVEEAIKRLSFMGKRAAQPLIETINTAVANSVNTMKGKKEALIIKTVDIGEGPKLKRFRPVSRGMAHSYVKRMSHITVVLSQKQEAA